MGGTCINVGCVPSKMLIYPADILATLTETDKLGINTTIDSINFNNIMSRMHELVNRDSAMQAAAVETTPNLTWFKGKGEFISDYTLQVGTHTIIANLIFIVSGIRATVPLIKGIENVSYLSSDTVLELQTQPKSIIIVGGGYIGMEYGHFFSAIGTKTTIIQRPFRVVPEEEPEISDLLKKELEKRMEIYTGYEALEIKQEDAIKTIVARNRQEGNTREFSAEAIMVATGRVSNAYLLKPEKTGVKLDDHNFIQVNEYLETSKKNIFAFGDCIGKQMFKHAANYEAGVAWHNIIHEHKAKVDFSAIPHAVFTHPQVASVGLKEDEAKQKFKILVGLSLYKDTAMGAALGFPEGFVKVIVEQQTHKILGAHIIGPEASVLIQEIVNAMVSGKGDFTPISQGIHIHPALNEVVQNAFGNLHEHEHER
ncbi:MAG TPA: dihydrolipoyl dehydrogenase, partial [Candidatus Bathyarchaeia archaeon]